MRLLVCSSHPPSTHRWLLQIQTVVADSGGTRASHAATLPLHEGVLHSQTHLVAMVHARRAVYNGVSDLQRRRACSPIGFERSLTY
jgi:hypothetical protein